MVSYWCFFLLKVWVLVSECQKTEGLHGCCNHLQSFMDCWQGRESRRLRAGTVLTQPTESNWHILIPSDNTWRPQLSRSMQIYPASWSSDLSPWLQNCPSRCFWSEKVSQVLAVAHWRHRGIVKRVTAAIDELIRCRHRAYVAALATDFSCQMLSCTIRKAPWVLCRHGDGVDGIVMFGHMK